MDDHQLELLLADLESDRVERKSAVSGNAKDEMRQAICAFANDLPNHQKPPEFRILQSHVFVTIRRRS